MQQLKERIFNCLSTLKGSGKFASVHTSDFLFPGLEVETVGEVSYPVNTLQANALIAAAQKAPFGKGSETILDNTVRSAWEIDAHRLRFNNPAWSKFLDKAIHRVKNDLGLEDYTISAQLYKLLIYEEGDFFLPHKDTEKEKGMFGTLVVTLPSRFTGGELLIQFEAEQVIADFSKSDPYSIHFTAFYADCDHEVKPLTSGYRVCLVYNLVQVKAAEKIELPSLKTHAGQLADIFTAHASIDRPYIILLGHQYTPENFSSEALKLNDRAKADAILLAAEKAGWYSKMCLVTANVTGVPEYDGQFGYDGYDDYGDYGGDEDAKMIDILDESLYIEHWIKNKWPDFDAISFEEEELITLFPLKEGEPIVKESSGYMGNYGPDLLHWYHYGAIMIWPPEVNAHLIRSDSVDTQLEWIAYFNRTGNVSETEALAVEQILVSGFGPKRLISLGVKYDAVADWLIWRNKVDFLSTLEDERLRFLFRKIDTDHWVSLLKAMTETQTVELLTKATKNIDAPVLEKWLAIIRAMAALEKFHTLAKVQLHKLPEHLQSVGRSSKRNINAAGLIDLFAIGEIFTLEPGLVTTIVSAFIDNLQRDYLHLVLAPELLAASTLSELTNQLLQSCQQYLKARIHDIPQPPPNWSRPMPVVTGNYKKQWEILQAFMESPEDVVFHYRRKQEERSALEHAIRNEIVDLKTETIKTGSPHTLRITKTKAAYHRAMQAWTEDKALFMALKSPGKRTTYN